MPSAPLRPRPSLQNLNGNETHPGSHHALPASKNFVQAYAVHRRDAPLNGLPNFPTRDPRVPPGSLLASPGFRLDNAASSVPDLSLLPKNMAGVQRYRSHELP